MARPKGKKSDYKFRSKEEKLKIVKDNIENGLGSVQIKNKYGISTGLLFSWRKAYLEKGIKGLEGKRRPGNPLSKFYNKELTKEEQLEYENMKLKIENERLKKGYIVKGDGQIEVFDMQKFKNSK